MSWWRHLLAAPSLLVAAAGCNGNIELHVDPAFTPKQYDMIVQRVNMWNSVTSDTKIELAAFDGNAEIVVGYPAPPAIAVTSPGESKIVMRPDLVDDRFSSAVAHELGHLLGLRHVESEPALMDPNASVPYLTPADINECRSRDVCD